MTTTDAALVWRRSQRCDNGDCVEVATIETVVALRDSTRPDGPVLRFTPTDWTRFMADIRAERLRTG